MEEKKRYESEEKRGEVLMRINEQITKKSVGKGNGNEAQKYKETKWKIKWFRGTSKKSECKEKGRRDKVEKRVTEEKKVRKE